MSDLKCTKCGTEATFADANIADLRRTCGAEFTPENSTNGHAGGEKHSWREL